MSLRVRLTLVAAAAVAVAVAGASLFAYRATHRELLREVDESLVERVEALAGFRPGPARRDPVDPARFPTPRFGAAGGFAQVVLDDGRILVAPGNDELPVSEQALDVASGTGGRLLEDVQVDGDRVRVLTEPFAEGVAVQVARPSTRSTPCSAGSAGSSRGDRRRGGARGRAGAGRGASRAPARPPAHGDRGGGHPDPRPRPPDRRRRP
ncbi:MAG: hypothetical protein M5U14_00365 [Acidimicrobiia bacterium]|nr:hypothetical protein [Acidimicrobiia bacterium]